MDTSALLSIVGVWILGALLWRERLSIPHAIFRFMNYHDGARAKWWRSARREASSMAEAVPMMFGHLGAPVSPVLFATDTRGADFRGDCGAHGAVANKVGEDVIRGFWRSA